MNPRTAFSALAAFGLMAVPSSAAISLVDSGTFSTGATSTAYDITASTGLNASAASKIVFTVSNEDGSGDGIVTGASFNGVAMTAAVSGTNSIQQAWIFYLDASTVSGGTFGTGNLVINGSGSDDIGASWLLLSGTADGVGPVNSATDVTVGLTTLVDDSFVVAAHANNSTSATAGTPLTSLLNADVGSAGGGSGYATVATAGAGSYSFTGNSRPITLAAAFAPIPEPGSALVGLLLGASLLRRRRA